MEEFEKKDYVGRSDRDEIFSKSVRAGKRTYFFDVKATKGNDLYLTLTESKKSFNRDGKPFFEKHKIFLYKEDFSKFKDGLEEAFAEIERLKNEDDSPYIKEDFVEEHPKNEFSDIQFEDI
jgi:hypothetical protein